MSQLVLVFEAALLDTIGRFQGYTREVERYLPLLLDPANNRFMVRDHAERDPAYKQLIPYVVLRYRDAVFQYVRGKRSTESRLIAMRSIGVGGHIEPTDQTLFASDDQLYRDAARREVEEEVEVGSRYREHIVALINDDSTEVGTVHFGIVHVWDLAEPQVRKREGLITQSGFTALTELDQETEGLETWSKYALDALRDPQVPPYSFPDS